LTAPTIAILTLRNDLHALAIQHACARFSDVGCVVIEMDSLASSGAFSWSSHDESVAELVDRSAKRIRPGNCAVAWYRRVGFHQATAQSADEAESDLINNDCRAAFAGLFATRFKGTWVSEPDATANAENKLLQLDTARRVGLRIPETLVSQNPDDVLRFCSQHARVIVKPVKGTIRRPLLTSRIVRPLTPEFLDAVSICPAIYQEEVPGTKHLRVVLFGNHCYSALLSAEALDWRANLDIPCSPTVISSALRERLLEFLSQMGLRMGVFDLKYVEESDVSVWLEVNPQGQFLFLEGMADLPLTDAFSDFLRETALLA